MSDRQVALASGKPLMVVIWLDRAHYYPMIVARELYIYIYISFHFIHATLKRPIFMGERGALAPKLITTAVAAVSRHKRAYTSTAPKTPKHTICI